MSGYKNPFAKEKAYPEINIEHITYDQTHKSMATSRPKESESHSRERPVTQWPGDYPSPPRPPKIWSQRAKIDENINKAAELPEPPALRRKSRLENIKEIFSRKSNEYKKEQYVDLRAAIQAGKMEQVVPPQDMQESWKEDAAPRRQENTPRPSNSYNTFRPSTSQNSSHSGPSQGRKVHPSSGKIGEMIEIFESGVEVVAETRRDIKSKFVEKMRFPLLRKEHYNNMEFACVGVNTEDFEEQEKVARDEDDPWAAKFYLGYCRLCRKPMVASTRGLCGDCEGDFRRPKSPERRDKREIGVEIRPTPPLKDKKYTPPQKEKIIPRSRFNFEDDDDEDVESLRPAAPLKNNEKIRLGDSKSKGKAVFQPAPFRESFRAELDDDDTRYTRWRTNIVRSDAEKTTQKQPRYMSGRSTTGHSDRLPMVPKKDNPKQSLRDTNFYGFYDEVIRDYNRSPRRRR